MAKLLDALRAQTEKTQSAPVAQSASVVEQPKDSSLLRPGVQIKPGVQTGVLYVKTEHPKLFKELAESGVLSGAVHSVVFHET